MADLLSMISQCLDANVPVFGYSVSIRSLWYFGILVSCVGLLLRALRGGDD